uniref:glutamate synthase-related protein n=1 Tax=Thiolapillus sp. TaxID=2017437 RepID=UPI003AF60503
ESLPLLVDKLNEYGLRERIRVIASGKLINPSDVTWALCMGQACLRPRDRFWDIPVPKIDSAFDNLFVPQPSWSPSTTQQLRKLVAAPYLAPNDWTPRSEAYFVFPLAQGTPGKQCGLAATGVYQPSLRSPWLAAADFIVSARGFMFTLGCIQALQCNKNTCPTGITTHDRKLQR